MHAGSSDLPARKWSIVALGSVGVFAVLLSYLLTLTLGIGLLSLPVVCFWQVQTPSFLALRVLLSIFGLIAGPTVLWSLVPRRDKFEAPGARIDLSREKRLAAEVEAIAKTLKEPMPSEVYLMLEANAFVAQRGGFMGIGSRRIMAVGLPLMQMLTIAQFRAVLAHEFGHFYAGDTRLGPWVYNARSAMVRVFTNLGERSELIQALTRFLVISLAHMLVMGGISLYWKFFMRLTQLISRSQEYRSDEIACHIAGSEALIAGLENMTKCNAALPAFWQRVVMPVAQHGYRPRLADGFMRFMEASNVAQATANHLQQAIANTKTDAMNTHPPLQRRIERARKYAIAEKQYTASGALSSEPMISLIDDLDALETQLLRPYLCADGGPELKLMDWNTAGSEVYVPAWRQQTAPYQSRLSQVPVKSLASLLRGRDALSNHILNPRGLLLSQAQREGPAREIVAIALALTLMDQGWSLVIEPGSFRTQRAELTIDPSQIVARMHAGQLPEPEWQTLCAQAGIGDYRLAASQESPAADTNS